MLLSRSMYCHIIIDITYEISLPLNMHEAGVTCGRSIPPYPRVTADPAGSPEVTLFHNDTRLSLSRFVRILYVDDRVSLVLCDVTPDMAGQYTVRAVNPAGEATSTATLEVQGESGELQG